MATTPIHVHEIRTTTLQRTGVTFHDRWGSPTCLRLRCHPVRHGEYVLERMHHYDASPGTRRWTEIYSVSCTDTAELVIRWLRRVCRPGEVGSVVGMLVEEQPHVRRWFTSPRIM